jgi:hypothetical protein
VQFIITAGNKHRPLNSAPLLQQGPGFTKIQ